MASLTCYRLKTLIDGRQPSSVEDFLDPDNGDLQTFGPVQGRNFSASLFMGPSLPREPGWMGFLRTGFDELPTRRTSFLAAVLIVRLGRRSSGSLFAFPFGGGGRFLLRQGAWDRGYGLRTALNLIYPRATDLDEATRLVSVDTKRRGGDTVRSRRQTSRATAFEAFDVDRLRDVMSAASGRPADTNAWGPRISGSDPLHFSIDELEFDDFGNLCMGVEAAYQRTDYRDRFGWLDHVQPVTDQELVRELEDRVLEILRSEETNDLELGPPEIVDWDRVKSFRYHFEVAKGITHPELRLSDYLRGVTRRTSLHEIDVPALRRKHIDAVDGDGTTVHRWTVWHCLDGEITIDDSTYVLDDGDFFLVAEDFMRSLNEYIAEIQEAEINLPSADARTREREFNEQAAAHNSNLLLLDRKTITTDASTTPVEICDLLSRDHQLIHVKRHLGARDLSHLFSQGFVSAELLQTDRAFRAKVKECIEKLGANKTFGFFDQAGLTTSEYEIVYAILANWGARSLSDALPFFSKVNLRRTTEDLRSRGFSVRHVRVQAA